MTDERSNDCPTLRGQGDLYRGTGADVLARRWPDGGELSMDGRKSPMRTASEARGLRLGQLLAGIEGARALLAIAHRSCDLLPSVKRKQLEKADALLAAIEQAEWIRNGKKGHP